MFPYLMRLNAENQCQDGSELVFIKLAWLHVIYIILERFIPWFKLKDSNYCFNSLAIRLWSKDLKHLISGNRLPKLQGLHICDLIYNSS